MRAVLLCLLLAGCATMERDLARATDTCRAIGHAEDSDAMRTCVQQVYSAERADRARMGAAILSRPAPPKPVTCTTLGNTTSCH